MFRKRYDKDLPILMEISSWEVIASLTAEGLGIGFFPDYVAQARKMHLKPYPHEFETIPYKVYAIFPKNIPKSPHAINFLKLLKSRHL
jgi:DNA-binding transcriptional LysR family regulator